MSEKNTQDACLELLSAKKVFHWRNNTGETKTASGGYVRYGYPGSPDIIAVIKGKFVGIEVKSIKGKLSDNQELFKIMLELSGGDYHVVRSIDQLIQILNDNYGI